jgi:pimeloyl-ACP methyl ester carboxylesterase
MYYQASGQGEPLVLLHGFGGSGARWASVVPELAKSYRVIVPDLRGHGRSTNPAKQFTDRQSALDMFALLDSLGIRQFKAILQEQFHSFKDSYDDMNFTRPFLSTITARTLIVHGDRDPFFADGTNVPSGQQSLSARLKWTVSRTIRHDDHEVATRQRGGGPHLGAGEGPISCWPRPNRPMATQDCSS